MTAARLKELYGAGLQPLFPFGDQKEEPQQYGVGTRDKPGALLFFIKEGRVSSIWVTRRVAPVMDDAER